MTFLLNLLWIVFGGGIILFIEYLLSGIALCVTIIGIPFGVQCFKLAIFALAPFGSEAVEASPGGGCLQVIFNIIWILLGGVWIALTHLALAVLFAITIIGIPFAVQHMKMAGLALTPFGKVIGSD
ncbi:MAG: YccF domain-containing protein [Deltaproteobacteria bacterium]|nr:YccF domain-containing protein [Deltaproteobacteria bacterium]